MKRIGVDLDGVISDFSGRFVKLANKKFGTDFSQLDQHDWDFKPWFTSEQVDRVWAEEIVPTVNFWQSLTPLEGTNRLYSLPKDIEPVFITSRVVTAGRSPREQSCQWLRQNFFITHPFVIVVDRPTDKVAILKCLGIESMVEDKLETVLKLYEAGIRTYCKLAPYNSQKPFPEGVLPVETFNDFVEQELKYGK